MSTGLTPTSSAVGMLEPVTMTRSAVAEALDAGTTFPCASRATGAGAPGEGEGIAATCAGTSGIMAKKIASITALLRNNPHSGSWALFIYLRRRLYNCQNNVDAAQRCSMIHAANWHPIKNRV